VPGSSPKPGVHGGPFARAIVRPAAASDVPPRGPGHRAVARQRPGTPPDGTPPDGTLTPGTPIPGSAREPRAGDIARRVVKSDRRALVACLPGALGSPARAGVRNRRTRVGTPSWVHSGRRRGSLPRAFSHAPRNGSMPATETYPCFIRCPAEGDFHNPGGWHTSSAAIMNFCGRICLGVNEQALVLQLRRDQRTACNRVFSPGREGPRLPR
jgi:hypothetical protein